MQFKTSAVALSLIMLSGCGGSDNGTTTSDAPEETVASPSPESTPAMEAAAQPSSVAPAAFAVCRSCHSIEKGKNGIGPSLAGIVGSKAGDVPGYAFSKALLESGIVWDRDSLDKWLQGPGKMVPGTKMMLSVSDEKKRGEIIDYLETLK